MYFVHFCVCTPMYSYILGLGVYIVLRSNLLCRRLASFFFFLISLPACERRWKDPSYGTAVGTIPVIVLCTWNFFGNPSVIRPIRARLVAPWATLPRGRSAALSACARTPRVVASFGKNPTDGVWWSKTAVGMHAHARRVHTRTKKLAIRSIGFWDDCMIAQSHDSSVTNIALMA